MAARVLVIAVGVLILVVACSQRAPPNPGSEVEFEASGLGRVNTPVAVSSGQEPLAVEAPSEGCLPFSKGQWNLERSDVGVTGYQPLPANIESPQLKWRLKMQSGQVPWAILSDLNGDGAPELIVPEADGIGAWTLGGEQIWFFPVTGFVFIDVLDLDENGSVEVILSLDGRGELPILEGSTGTLLTMLDAPREAKKYYYNIHVDRFLPGVRGYQIAFVANNPGAGTAPGTKIESYMFGFENGVEDAKLIWRKTIEESIPGDLRFIHWATSVSGDVDNDGVVELVAFVRNGLVIQDMSTGKIERSLPEIVGSGRNYGTVAILDVDKDDLNELLVLSDLLSLHLESIRFTDAENSLNWKKSYGAVWPNGSSFLHFPGAGSIKDVNGDGISEIILSERTDTEGWELRIIDAVNGELIGSRPDLYVLWVGDLTGDGISEVVATRTEGTLPREFGDIELLSFMGNTWTSLWKIENVRLESRIGYPLNEPIRYPSHMRGRSQDARQPFLIDWDGDGFLDMFLREDSNGDGKGERWLTVGYDGKIFRSKAVLFLESDTASRIIAVAEDSVKNGSSVFVSTSTGGKIRIFAGDDVVGSFETRQRFDYRYLIADTDGDCTNEVVIHDAAGVSVVTIHTSGSPNPKLPVENTTLRWNIPGNLLLTADLDGQPGVEVVIARTVPGGGVAVAAIKGDGTPLWETTIPTLFRSPLLQPIVRAATVGRFSGREGLDLYVVGRLTVPTGNGNTDRSWVLRGDTGEILWYNDASDERFPLPRLGPGKDAGAVPIDINHDGADDLAMVSQHVYLALDGKTGQILHNPTSAIHALQNGTGIPSEWTAYSALAIVDVDLDGENELLLHNSAGAWGPILLRPLNGPFGELPVQGIWKEIPKLDNRQYASIANVDESVEREIVVADNSIRVYDAATGRVKYEFKDVIGGEFVSTVKMAHADGAEIVASGENNVSLIRVPGGPGVVWTFTTDTQIGGQPVIGDVDADGWSEIVVSTIAGDLLVIDGN